MASFLGLRFSPRIVLLGVVFAALATSAFIAFRGLYREMFSLLMGWVVVFVLVARAVLGEEDEPDEGVPPRQEGGLGAGDGTGDEVESHGERRDEAEPGGGIGDEAEARGGTGDDAGDP